MVNINATLIAQAINFLFLVFVLAKFAYKPLAKMMEDRKNKIASDLEAAEKARTDAEAIQKECADKLAAARQEAAAIIEEATKAAQAAKDKAVADTKAEQERIIADAKAAIASDKKAAMDDVRAQVVDLAMAAAGKIIGQKLGTDEDKKLAGEIVDSVMSK
ncbi:MAG: F0F1 ATP synthase subunit B [Acidaminococcaceae bacterium]|nr:F0F1 ATP synthase subunit B [Acidaminococcaceae bacterium]